MSTATVHIVLSDEGWILHALARQLQQNLPQVTYDLDVDPSADIQYYMTYGTWRYRVSAREIGYFAHIEQDEATQRKFYNVADHVDWAVCHSRPYEALLREHGMANVVTIPPGVDLERFQPKVKIGVVGRTYHTGRKGEHLVAAVMDVPGIEWHFTGTGWPGPALMLPDDRMPDFYRSMDYILVPSLYEGGPMSVIEALACGCQVIAPPVGWVPEYPHIEYRTGDADDLRRVLAEVVAERMALRRTVLDRGWATWIGGHERLFARVAGTIEGLAPTKVSLAGTAPHAVRRPGLIVHGTEKGTDKGGPSVRAPRTALRLTRAGYDATLLDSLMFDQRAHDLYHIYNIWNPRTCRQAMEHVRLSGAPVVLSPIYLDLSEKRTFDRDIPKLFGRGFGRAMINDEYARLREVKARRLSRAGGRPPEPHEGFHAEVRNLVSNADHLILLSEDERRKLDAIGADTSRATVVPNPVEPGLYANASPDLFREAYGVQDYVLCVGRLEARKNQITLLHALRDSGLPLVLIGHAASPDYERLLRSVAGANAVFVGRVPANSPMLASAYAGARVFCLPSWSEGAPLVALEAAAAGCNMVLSDRSSEREYFGARSRYCDPCNPDQMLAAITEAYENPFDAAQRAELAAWTAARYSWDAHIQATAAVYEAVAASRQSRPAPRKPPRIYIDLTSSAHRSGPPSGIARVEERYAMELYDLLPGQVVFVLWNSHRRAFIEVSHDQFLRGRHKQLPSVDAPSYLFDETDFSPAGRVPFERDSVLLVLGGAWIRNENYVHSLAATKRLKGLVLVAFIHDVIQAKFKQWFPDRVGDEFAYNCRALVEVSDHLIVNSQCTLDDLREFSEAERLVTPPTDTVRFGDEIETLNFEAEEEPQFDRLQPILRGRPFVLCVSAIDIRKNHLMLHNIWERMLAEHGARTPNLIMVGSKGWNIDHFLALVEKNPKIRDHFHILNGINDATLDWLYRNCLFTVYPSLYEGWGLPVAEALNYGKVCVAARAGSVPEIAPEMTDLIDPLDFVTWYRTVTGYVLNPQMLAAREEHVRAYRPVSWKQSAIWLRDLLMNVSGQRRPLPPLQIGKSLALDEAAAKSQKVQLYKVGGWYAPERRGSWTAGSVAMFQCELQGEMAGPLLLEISGNAFVSDDHPIQGAAVEINDEPIGTLCWGGAASSDLLVIPRRQVEAVRSARELTLGLRPSHPRSPASLNPESTDRRLLGLMVSSIGVRTMPVLMPAVWTDARENRDVDQSGATPVVSHGMGGGRSLKLPIAIAGTDLPPGFAPGGVAFVGFRFVVRGTADAELAFYVGGGWLRHAVVKPGRVETRFVCVTLAQLTQGCILEVLCQRPGIADIQLIEYGVFPSVAAESLLPVQVGTILDLALASAAADPGPAETLAASWGIGRAQLPTRDAAQVAFLTGWSRFEREGTWSLGHRAYLGLQIGGVQIGGLQIRPDDAGTVVLGFRLRPYRARHLDVSCNGGPVHRWNFKGPGQQIRFLPIDPGDLADGRAVIEFRIEGAVSPAEAEGKEDDRMLGVFLASVAVLNAATLSLSPTRNVPQLVPDTVCCFVAAENWLSQADSDLNQSQLGILPRSEAEPILLAGWSNPEAGGVWSDGDSASLLLRFDRTTLPPGQALTLVLDLRSYRTRELRLRAEGGDWTTHRLDPKKPQRCLLALPWAQLATGSALIELRPVDAASPAQGGQGGDERRLGIFLYAAALLRQETWATLRHRKAVRHRPRPVVLDCASDALEAAAEIENWYPPEVHGRWTGQEPARITLRGHGFTGDVRLAILARTLDVDLPEPQALTVAVNGVDCGVSPMRHGLFEKLDFTLPAKAVAAAPELRLELRCSYVASPAELGASSDRRPLGVLVRSLALTEPSEGGAAVAMPGAELCHTAQPSPVEPAVGIG